MDGVRARPQHRAPRLQRVERELLITMSVLAFTIGMSAAAVHESARDGHGGWNLFFAVMTVATLYLYGWTALAWVRWRE